MTKQVRVYSTCRVSCLGFRLQFLRGEGSHQCLEGSAGRIPRAGVVIVVELCRGGLYEGRRLVDGHARRLEGVVGGWAEGHHGRRVAPLRGVRRLVGALPGGLSV